MAGDKGDKGRPKRETSEKNNKKLSLKPRSEKKVKNEKGLKEPEKKEVKEVIIEKKETKEVSTEKSNKEPISQDPYLSDAVSEKSYSSKNVVIENGNFGDIPEQVIERPVIRLGVSEESDVTDTSTKKASSQPEQENIEFPPPSSENTSNEPSGFENYSMNDVPTKEKKQGAENFADMILFGYKWIYEQVGRIASLDDAKIQKKAIKGRIDIDALSIPIQISETESVTAYEFISEYNDKVEEATTVSEEFIERVRPALIRILMKKGVGMTDEQSLMFSFGKDALGRIASLTGAKMTMNAMLKHSMDLMEERKASMRPNIHVPQPPPPPPAPKEEGKEEKPKEDILEENNKSDRDKPIETITAEVVTGDGRDVFVNEPEE